MTDATSGCSEINGRHITADGTRYPRVGSTAFDRVQLLVIFDSANSENVTRIISIIIEQTYTRATLGKQ